MCVSNLAIPATKPARSLPITSAELSIKALTKVKFPNYRGVKLILDQARSTEQSAMRIKATLSISFLLISSTCFAQQIRGTIMDADTKTPIYLAIISNGKDSTYSDVNGNFRIAPTKRTDTLLIRRTGFRTRQMIPAQQISLEKLTIYLSPSSISLIEVQIKARARYKQDSLRMRKEFSDVFNYKPKGIKDLFVSRSAASRKKGFRDPNSNSTASIVSLNMLEIAGMLARRKNPVAKLKNTLLQEEQNKSVDQSFSKARISAITRLHGDSLLLFMNQYRPSALEIQEMSAYDLMLYVKKSYQAFIGMSGKPESLPVLQKIED
jgi:hypothetical protein